MGSPKPFSTVNPYDVFNIPRPKPFYTVRVNPYDEFTVPRRYQNLNLIACGSGGVVCSATDTDSGGKVAIKKMANPCRNPFIAVSSSYRELMLMKAVEHKHVIKLLNAFTPQDSIQKFTDMYLVMELKEFDLSEINTRDLSLEHKSFLICQILCGVKHLHSGGIIHRDLKLENVVLSGDSSVALIDLGLARTAPTGSLDETFKMTYGVTTRGSRAPEVCLDLRYNAKVDVWSIGCIMAELIRGKPLFRDNDDYRHFRSVLKIVGTPDQDYIHQIKPQAKRLLRKLRHQPGKSFESLFPDDIMFNSSTEAHFQPTSARDLLAKMLVFDPAKRISVDEALDHPFIRPQWHLEDILAPAPPAAPYDASLEKSDMSVEDWKAVIFKELQPPKP